VIAARVVGAIGVVLYGAALCFALLSPYPVSDLYFVAVDRILSALHALGVPDWFGVISFERLANVVVFVPLGVFAAMLLPLRLWWVAFGACAAVSAVGELVQTVALDTRDGSPLDFALNCLGAAIGVGIVCLVRGIRRSSARS
jgi:glycopeptide antibiotics resistance protein